jgi:hypothetical protein
MSFRQFGGLKYNAKHNAVSSNFNTSNNVVIREDAGISNNLKVTNNLLVQGDADICGNLTAYHMFLSSGNNYSTESNAVVPKSYVDTIATGLHILQSVTCISTIANRSYTDTYPVPIYPYNVTNEFLINGYSVQVGDAVLLNDQGSQSLNYGESVDNGVYDLSCNGNDYYFTRSTSELSLGSNAKGAYIKTINGIINPGSGWVQVRNPAIVGINPLLFYTFNPSSSSDYAPGIGLYTTISQDGTTYFNVDSSLNFLTGIDASNNGILDVGTQSSTLNLGSVDTSVNIAGNPYVYTPYSLGSTFAPEIVDISCSSTSTEITFTWEIPNSNNISSTFQNINATLYANISGNIKSYQILTNNSSNITTLNNIIVTNQLSTSDFIDTSTYNYYNLDFTDMNNDSSNNQLILWYTNYSPYPNVSYKGYSAFSSIGVPGPVFFGASPATTEASVNSSFGVTDGTVTLPCYVKVVDTSNILVEKPPFITHYQSQYTTPGSTNRYPEPYIDGSGQTFSATPNSGSYENTSCEFQNMYPDCSYSFYVKAKNGGNLSYGPTNDPSHNYSTLPPIYPPTILPSTSLFNTNNYIYPNGGYFVSNNSSASPILNNNNFTTPLQSDNIITPVQQFGLYYGNNSLLDSLNVTASILHNSQTTDSLVNVLSFGNATDISNNTGGIIVTARTFDAYYNGPEYNQGFYLDCSTNMTITQTYLNNYLQTPNLFTATLTCTGNNVNLPTPTSSYSFYADNINSDPSYNSIGGFTINPNNDNKYYSNQVSGIWVLHNSTSPVFTITDLKLNSMGTYFYASPLVTYNITGGATGNLSETNTNNITNKIGDQFNTFIDISNNSVGPITISDSYHKSIQLDISFKNLYGSGSKTNANTINVICDTPSYTLSNSIKTLNGLTITPSIGYRVWSANVDSGVPSGTMDPSGIVPYPYILSGTTLPNETQAGSDQGYVDISYNNVWNIASNLVTNQELLVANGKFTTNSNYYLNYSSISSANGNNDVNYSALDTTGNHGIKFSTFAWNAIDISPSYKNLNFEINLSSNIYYQNTKNTFFFDTAYTKPLYLFYRFEYTTNVAAWGSPDSGTNYYPNTTWISINTSTTDENQGNNTTNVCNINNVEKVYYNAATFPSTSNSQLSGTITIKSVRPTINISSYSATLYLRIGIPNGYDGFSFINCYLSES